MRRLTLGLSSAVVTSRCARLITNSRNAYQWASCVECRAF
jgi:hypothetical protein